MMLQLPPQLLEATTVPLLGSLSQTVSLGQARANILETTKRSRRGEELEEADKSGAEDTDRGHVSSFFFYFGMGYDSAGGRWQELLLERSEPLREDVWLCLSDQNLKHQVWHRLCEKLKPESEEDVLPVNKSEMTINHLCFHNYWKQKCKEFV